jgi:hypothetical protein
LPAGGLLAVVCLNYDYMCSVIWFSYDRVVAVLCLYMFGHSIFGWPYSWYIYIFITV